MTDTLASGFLLAGRYRIQNLIGSGGMGAVYKAADTRLDGRILAVKELTEKAGFSPQDIAESTAAFHQEARLLAGLHHPNLPSIHDHFIDDGRWYLVMDLIEGQTLEDYLQHHGTPGLPVNEVLRLANQICAVLQYLHAFSPPIIFRDLKPSNIMLTSSGHLYLIDFGIARIFKPGQTRDTVAIGTPGYAAPEQHGRSQTTVRSDIFSFGVILHQLLTGIDPSVRPFTFPPILPLNPQTPPRLEALIFWMVQMDESRRPVNIVVVRHELDQIASLTSTASPTGPAQQIPSYSGYTTPTYPVPPGPAPIGYASIPVNRPRTRTGTRWILASIGAAMAVVCAVTVICAALTNAFGLGPSTAATQGPSPTSATLPTATSLPSATPTATPLPSPTPTVSPITLTGSTSKPYGENVFTMPVPWHVRATCTTPGQQSPYSITVGVYESMPNGMETVVGQGISFYCNGQSVDSNQSNPGGFPVGTYSLQVVTGGNWTLVVLAE